MKAILAICPLILLFLAPGFASAQAPASLPPDAHIAYVSGQKISTDSAAGKAGAARVRALQQERATEIRTKQQALEVTKQQLARATAPEERTRLTAQASAEQSDIDRSTAQAQMDLQALQREISNELRPRVIAVLNEILKDTQVEVVANVDTTLVWSRPGLDLTAAVIERLDATEGAAATPVAPPPVSPPATPAPPPANR